MNTVSIDKRGPLFDGRLEKAVADACDTSEKRIATLGASMVRSRLSRVLKKETPYYRFRVVAQPARPGWKVTDQGVIYGFWLEGIGRRNFPVTRFRGYHSFKIVTDQLRDKATIVCEGVVLEYLGRL